MPSDDASCHGTDDTMTRVVQPEQGFEALDDDDVACCRR